MVWVKVHEYLILFTGQKGRFLVCGTVLKITRLGNGRMREILMVFSDVTSNNGLQSR